MAINKTLIRRSFRKALAAVTGYPGDDDMAFEGRPFTPKDPLPKDYIYMTEHLIVVSEKQSGSNMIQLDAYMKYEIRSVFGQGTERSETLSNAITGALQPGTLLNDPERVNIIRCEPLTGRQEFTWWVIPIHVLFVCYVTKE